MWWLCPLHFLSYHADYQSLLRTADLLTAPLWHHIYCCCSTVMSCMERKPNDQFAWEYKCVMNINEWNAHVGSKLFMEFLKIKTLHRNVYGNLTLPYIMELITVQNDFVNNTIPLMLTNGAVVFYDGTLSAGVIKLHDRLIFIFWWHQ